MKQLAKMQIVFLIVSRSSLLPSASHFSSSSSPPSSSASISAHIELYRVIFGREAPKVLHIKPSSEQLLIQKILSDNDKVLALTLNHRRQFRRANIARRAKDKKVEEGKRGKKKTETQRLREERMSLFLGLLKQHRLLLAKDTVMAAAEYFAEANCYTSFMASYGLMRDPSELLGT